jgi:hypothetical protein
MMTNEIRCSSGSKGPVLIRETDRRVEVVGEIEAHRRVDVLVETKRTSPLGPLNERDFGADTGSAGA